MLRSFGPAFLACGLAAAGAATIPTAAVAQDMSAVDRRLYVAVVPYLNEAGAEDALESGANINLRDPAMRNDTLLILALRQFVDAATIRWILEHGGDPSLTNDEGRTALSIARQLNIGNTANGREVLRLLGGASGGKAAAQGAAPAPAANGGRAERPGVDPVTGRGFTEIPKASGATGGPPPQPGVYECINQGAVRTPMSFGILDGSTYMSSTGRTGRYTYDSATGILTLSQSGQSARFQRAGPTWFRPFQPGTSTLAGFTCPLNKAKDPRRPNTW